MNNALDNERKMTGIFERYLTVWVGLCIVGGILLGKIAPNLAKTLDGMSINIGGAPVVSIPIAICLFFMMYPIMVKIDFASVIKAGKTGGNQNASNSFVEKLFCRLYSPGDSALYSNGSDLLNDLSITE